MAREGNSQKSVESLKGRTETDPDSVLQSLVAPEFEDARYAAAEQSTVTKGPASQQPGNTSRASGVAAEPTRPQPERQDNESQTSQGDTTGNRSESHALMYSVAMKGDWQTAEFLLRRDPNIARDKITERGDTALHIAAAMKRAKFVRKLVQWMNPKDLELRNTNNQTAFCYAAASGIVEIAAAMREKNDSLLTLCDEIKITPLYIAARLRKTDMVSYLYKFTRFQDMETKQWFLILVAMVKNDIYDVALDILRHNDFLATMRVNEVKTVLHLLAQKDTSDISAIQEAICKSFVTMLAAFHCLSWLKRIFEQPLMQKRAGELAKKLWLDVQTLGRYNAFELINEPPILHEAAKVGNAWFITMLARSNPDLLFKYDDKGHSIFHVAVEYRQENVFSLIHQTGALKDLIAVSKDKEGNNMLHLAGKSAPLGRKEIVSGAALQMQRELLWFKEVEKIVLPDFLQKENNAGHRPRKLFSEQHKDLVKEGEKWMKKTANSCMLMATLIATVVFAAAFTVPGGNKGETGTPVLLGRGWFTVFVVSDAVAMFCSTSSIILFLSILTSRYQEDDFLVSLPRKLILGLTTLFASIISTIAGFTSAFFLLFTTERDWIPKWVAALACVSLTGLFGCLHFKLWVDMIQSTYLSGRMFHSGKHSFY